MWDDVQDRRVKHILQCLFWRWVKKDTLPSENVPINFFLDAVLVLWTAGM